MLFGSIMFNELLKDDMLSLAPDQINKCVDVEGTRILVLFSVHLPTSLTRNSMKKAIKINKFQQKANAIQPHEQSILEKVPFG